MKNVNGRKEIEISRIFRTGFTFSKLLAFTFPGCFGLTFINTKSELQLNKEKTKDIENPY